MKMPLLQMSSKKILPMLKWSLFLDKSVYEAGILELPLGAELGNQDLLRFDITCEGKGTHAYERRGRDEKLGSNHSGSLPRRAFLGA